MGTPYLCSSEEHKCGGQKLCKHLVHKFDQLFTANEQIFPLNTFSNTFSIQKLYYRAIKLFFGICDGLLGCHVNATRSKLGNLERAVFSKRKTFCLFTLYTCHFRFQQQRIKNSAITNDRKGQLETLASMALLNSVRTKLSNRVIFPL